MTNSWNGRKAKMTKAISEENKARISDLVKQREDLEERLEMLSYTKNTVKITEIEQEIYEINDTINKLKGSI
jgi:hypothetical protein|tara:strand:+ start:370 stop:585 length:216 start_codon:yes stop_codon:yes gene_type:complete